MTYQAPTQKLNERPVPPWVGVLIALVIVGAMAVGIGMWFWGPKPPAGAVDVNPGGVNRRGGNPARIVRNVPAIGINQVDANTFEIMQPNAILRATRQPATPKEWALSFRYRNMPDLINAEQQAALAARSRLGTDTFFAKTLKVTDEQITKLRQIPQISSFATPGMIVSPKDRQKMKAVMDEYIAAPQKPASQQAVLKTLDDISKASVPNTKAEAERLSKQIQAVLTPEQIAAFKP